MNSLIETTQADKIWLLVLLLQGGLKTLFAEIWMLNQFKLNTLRKSLIFILSNPSLVHEKVGICIFNFIINY